MKNSTKTILFSLTALLLFAFAIQQHTGLFKFMELNGVTQTNTEPQWSFRDFRDGTLQRNFEAYNKDHYGFREPLTRLYNQNLWTFFRYSKVVEDRRIIFSDDNWLFEPWTVEEYYGNRFYRFAKDSADMSHKLDAEAQRLRQLKSILDPLGIHLFVAILPGKETVCAEHMPKNTEGFCEKQFTAADYYSKRLEELDVDLVDFRKWFVQIKDTVDYPLFPQTGTHWSNLAALHVADSLLHYLEQLGGMNLLDLKIGSIYQRTVKPDNDLESLMNLIWPLKKTPNYLAGYHYVDDVTASRPKIITIGDSFYWNMINTASFGTAFRCFPYWYYFSTTYFNYPYQNVSELDLLAEVLSSNFIMLSYSTATIYGMSNGFSERLLLELCYENEEIDARLNQIRNAILSDTAWKDRVSLHAWRKERLFEKELTYEINATAFDNLETYFPALCDSIPTQRSKRFLLYTEHRSFIKKH